MLAISLFSLPSDLFCECIHDMCNRPLPVDMCVKMSVPATRDHLPRGDTLAPNRQCPLVAGTTVLVSFECFLLGLFPFVFQ